MRSESEGLLPQAALGEHRSFLHRLAKGLVRDDALADDVVQETLLVAMERRPRSAGAWRAWLGRVCQRLALRTLRTRSRASRREAEVARSEALPSAAELAEREAALTEVTRAVLALPDELRRVVMLHHYEGRSAAEIARGLGLPATTVRGRLQRAHERLRASLDGRFDGGRSVWGAALLGLVGESTPTPPLAPPSHPAGSSGAGSLATGTLLMGTKTKLTAAAAVIAAGFIGGWQWIGGGIEPEPTEPVRPARTVLQEPEPLPTTVAAVTAPAPARIAVQEEPEPPAVVPEPAPTTGSLELSVRHSDGTVAAGRAFDLRDRGLSQPERWTRSARTDQNGVLRVDDLPPGELSFSGDTAGHGRATIVAGEVTRTELKLPAGIDVHGRVVDPDGHPVARAEVWLSHYGWRLDGAVVARSDEEGRFRLKDVEDGRNLGAWSRKHSGSRLVWLFGAPGETQEIELALGAPAARISGRLMCADGTPVVGASVRARANPDVDRPGQDGRPAFKVISDEKGSFDLVGIPPGPIELGVRSDEYACKVQRMELSEGQRVSQTLILLRAPVVEGVVRDPDGDPVDGANVACGDIFALNGFRAHTGADGAFRLRGLPVGTRTLKVEHERGSASVELELRAGETVRWDPELEPGRVLLGRVTDGRGGGREGFLVEVIAMRAEPGTTALWSARVHTDREGRFEAAACPEGELFVRVQRSERTTTVLASRRGIRADGSELVIELPDSALPTASISGRVVGPDGEPVAASIQATLVGGYAGYNVVETDPVDGSFRLGELPPGEYRLIATPRELPRQELATVKVGPEEEGELGKLFLARPGRLVLEVNGNDQDLRPFERILVRELDGLLPGLDLAVGPGGRVAEELLLVPGTYTVTAWGRDVALESGRFEVAEGELRRHPLKARPGVEVRFEWGFGPGSTKPQLLTWILEQDGRRLTSGTLGIPEPDEWAVERRLMPGTYVLNTRDENGPRAVLELEVAPSAEPLVHRIELN